MSRWPLSQSRLRVEWELLLHFFVALSNFRAYQLSVQFYRSCQKIRCSKHLKDQLDRASSSVALNLSEGSAKSSTKDRLRFYFIAFGSLRECQTILELVEIEKSSELGKLSDQLGGQLFKLCKSLEDQLKTDRP